ncbi:MAG: adenosylcobinamide-GDP ribazoletransferase, partial [Candidatus Bipolaricaulia bacterium]
GLRGGFAFETTFPIGKGEEDFWAFVDRPFLFPVIGLIVGGLLGGIGIILSFIPPFIGASLFMIALYLTCGILHTDGLADFADALVTGGTHAEREEVMKDEKTGAAGLVSILATNLLLFSGLVELFSESNLFFVFFVIIAAEVLSKETMISLLFFGRSAHEGLGSTFIERTGAYDLGGGTVISIAVLIVFWSPLALVPLLLALITGFGLVRLGFRVIGGVNGDIVGAGGEIVRALVIISFVLLNQLELPSLGFSIVEIF